MCTRRRIGFKFLRNCSKIIKYSCLGQKWSVDPSVWPPSQWHLVLSWRLMSDTPAHAQRVKDCPMSPHTWAGHSWLHQEFQWVSLPTRDDLEKVNLWQSRIWKPRHRWLKEFTSCKVWKEGNGIHDSHLHIFDSADMKKRSLTYSVHLQGHFLSLYLIWFIPITGFKTIYKDSYDTRWMRFQLQGNKIRVKGKIKAGKNNI